MARKKKAKNPQVEDYGHGYAKRKNMPLSHIWIFDVRDAAPMASPMSASWVEYICDQCLDAQVPFFFKQWGGFNKKKERRLLDGRTWDDMPTIYEKRKLGAHGGAHGLPVTER